MFKKYAFVWSLACLLLCCWSCKKQEGFGGNARLRGNVHVLDYNTTFTLLLGEYPAIDESVYLVLGNDLSYTERIRTNPQGDFEFKYLYPGTYTVYTYSNDSSFLLPQVAVSRTLTIEDKDAAVQLDTMIVFK